MSDYKKGDKVEVLKTGEKKEIIDIAYEMPFIQGKTPVECYILDNNRTYKANEIKKIDKPAYEKNCECGMWKVYGKDCAVSFHEDYCPINPLYKEKK